MVGRPDVRTIGVTLAALAGLMAIDVFGGRAVIESVRIVLVADLCVIAAVILARWSPVLAVGLAAAASIVISFKTVDWQPEWVVVTGYRGALPGLAELGGIAFLVVWCGRMLRRWQAIPAWIALATVLAALVAVRNRGNHTEVMAVVAGFGFIAVFGVCEFLRSTDRMQQQRAEQARVDERAAIARELHDLVAHHVTGIVLQAQAAQLVATQSPQAAGEALGMIERAGADALRSMRAIVGSLRAADGAAPLEPTATVDDLLDIGRRHHPGEVPVRLRVVGHLDDLPASVIASLHRVAMEAVTNARRHGRGVTAIEVRIVCGDRRVEVDVVNDGALAPPRNGGGFGLVGIAERVAALGGTVTTGPRPEGGWAVHAMIPA